MIGMLIGFFVYSMGLVWDVKMIFVYPMFTEYIEVLYMLRTMMLYYSVFLVWYEGRCMISVYPMFNEYIKVLHFLWTIVLYYSVFQCVTGADVSLRARQLVLRSVIDWFGSYELLVCSRWLIMYSYSYIVHQGLIVNHWMLFKCGNLICTIIWALLTCCELCLKGILLITLWQELCSLILFYLNYYV